jgi:hypothetical protein
MIKWNVLPTNVIVRFAPLAGGKFFSSMLSYYENFQHFLPIDLMDYDFEYDDLDSLSHYVKMRTIPEKKYRNHWYMFETQFKKFWGFNLTTLLKEEHYVTREKLSIDDTYELIPEKTLKLLFKKYCFHIVHESSYKELKTLMPNCKIITIVEAEELQKASLKFKRHQVDSKRYIDVLEGKDCYTFSMKNIFNKKLFFNDLSDLAFELSGNNSFDSRMEEYYDKYVEIHKDD